MARRESPQYQGGAQRDAQGGECMSVDTYNPNALVTYKKIAGTYAEPEAPEYITDKVVDLEWTLHQGREARTEAQKLRATIASIQEHMTRNDWYNPNTEASEILAALQEILGYEPKAEIRITAVIEVEVTVELNMDEVEDFDAETWIGDWVSVDTSSGDSSCDSWAVSSADWEDA